MSNWLPESPALFLFLSGRLGKELLLCDVVTPLSSAVFLRRRDVGDVNGHVYGVNFFIPPPLSWSVVWIVSPAWGRYLALTQFYRVFTEFFFGRFSKPTTHRTHSAPWYRVPTEFRRWIRFYRVLFLCRFFFCTEWTMKRGPSPFGRRLRWRLFLFAKIDWHRRRAPSPPLSLFFARPSVVFLDVFAWKYARNPLRGPLVWPTSKPLRDDRKTRSKSGRARETAQNWIWCSWKTCRTPFLFITRMAKFRSKF